MFRQRPVPVANFAIASQGHGGALILIAHRTAYDTFHLATVGKLCAADYDSLAWKLVTAKLEAGELHTRTYPLYCLSELVAG